MCSIHRSHLCAKAIGLGALTLFAASVLAQPVQPGTATTPPVIEIRSAGITSVEPHPKDVAAFAAFTMLGDRLNELGDELDLNTEQRHGIALLWQLVNSGMALRVDLSEQGPGFALAISPQGEAGAAALTQTISQIMHETGMPMDFDEHGNLMASTPIGPATIMTADANGEQFTRISAGAAGEITPGVSRGDLPDNAIPMMSGSIDLERLGAFMLPMIAQDDEMAAKQIEASGWMGKGAPTAEFVIGVSESNTHTIVRLRNALQATQKTGSLTGLFELSHFSAVPADATVVSGSNQSLSSLVNMLEQTWAQDAVDPIAVANETLGIDLRADILENIGPGMIYYQANSTGGNGLLSSVLLIDLKDSSTFAGAMQRVFEFVNKRIAQDANGYVRFRPWAIADAPAISITFPGLPIPLEISWCVHQGRLVIAATPTGLFGAVEHLDQGKQSILDNELFIASVSDHWPKGGPVIVTFTDAAHLAQKGYGLTNMLTSALANAARSPANPDRVSGPLMPGFKQFNTGISPYTEIGWWEGNDLIIHSTSDRSMLVQIATGAGMLSDTGGLAVPALMAGILLPALGKARQSANQLKASTQVRGVVQALMLYMGANDAMPGSVDELIADGFMPAELLDSPYGHAPDGGPSIALRVNMSIDRAYSFEAQTILAIDRSMLFAGTGQVLVGFADSHVALITIQELEELLENPKNEGAREELQIPVVPVKNP